MALAQVTARERTPVHPAAGGAAPARRRRVALAYAAVVALTALAAGGSGSAAAWWAVAGVLCLGAGYVAVLHHVRGTAAEREFGALLGSCGGSRDIWGGLSPAVSSLDADRDDRAALIPAGAGRQVLALTKFVLADLAGWALSPLVFGLTLLLRETPRDSTGQRWLANLEAAQQRLKATSARALVVSATTAGVTAAGIAAVGGAGVASATPVAASATVVEGFGHAPAAAAPALYRVVGGDTLSAIAARFGTTVAALAAANRIADPNLIYAGQVLRIGSPAARAVWRPETTLPRTYRVVAGDTLARIATRFGTTVAALAATNRIADPNLIYAGQVLRIGSPAARAGRAPVRHADAAARTPAAATAVRVALEQVGKPYRWGGSGPGSFDCSGLVMYAWEHAGAPLPHYSVAQYEDTARITEAQLRPGDLVFYDTGGGSQPGHVTIYIGGGKVVTADMPGTEIKVVPLTWDGVPMGFGRVR